MWCTWCFRQRTCGLVGVRRLSAVGYRLSAVRCPLSDVRCPMAAGTVFPKVDTPYGQAPMGLEGSGASRRPDSIVRVLRTERWVQPTERAGSEGSFICRLRRQENRTTALRASEMHSPFGGWRHHLARWEACHWIRGSQSSPMNPVPLPPPSSRWHNNPCLLVEPLTK